MIRAPMILCALIARDWSNLGVRGDVVGALDAGPGQLVAPPADNAALAAVLGIYNLSAG